MVLLDDTLGARPDDGGVDCMPVKTFNRISQYSVTHTSAEHMSISHSAQQILDSIGLSTCFLSISTGFVSFWNVLIIDLIELSSCASVYE